MANIRTSFFTKFNAALKAFRQPDLIVSDLLQADSDFISYDSRRIRYNIFWAFYENSVFNNIHAWAKTYRYDHALYKHIRNIYNPTEAIIDFWSTYLWGNIDFESNNEQLITDVNTILQWSNWETLDSIAAFNGALLGDVFLKPTHDAKRNQVFLEIVHPGNVESLRLDSRGNIKKYTILEERVDPEKDNQTVIYREEVDNIEGEVTFKTFKDNIPFDWNGVEAEQILPINFAPLISIKHKNIGREFGLSEIHSSRSLIHEIDEQASILSDHIRKKANPPAILSGARLSKDQSAKTETRDSQLILEGGSTSQWLPLTTDLEVEAITNNIRALLDQIENSFPELQLAKNSLTTGTEKSGTSIREIRKRATSKVEQKRKVYDQGLTHAIQMCLSYAGAVLEEFQYEPETDFTAGNLDFTIKDRPIFKQDEQDKLDINKGKSEIVQTLTNSGSSIFSAAIIAGYTEEEAEQLQQIELLDER